MYQSVIGLEIHIELNTKSKMFCSCRNDSLERHPNINICPICLGHPGTLPVINKEAVRKVIKTGLALNCQIPEYSQFNRKNYFYPDLPKGYQISQYDLPLCKGGFLMVGEKKIRIKRVHLEEDTAKLIHPPGRNFSLVDFNRAGIPLMELVTEPDISSAQEAKKFTQELRLILRYLDVSEADMEKGQLRIEANVSLQRKSRKSKVESRNKLGTKVEIKNLNSLRAVEKAIEYEIKRQKEILKEGKKVIQETRGWDDVKEITVSQREKEQAQDYRYFPEPDLPALQFSPKEIEEIKAGIPELPYQKRERFKKEYGLEEKEIEVFIKWKELGEYFEKVLSELRNWIKESEQKPEVSEKEFKKLVNFSKNYLAVELLGLLGEIKVDDKKFPITPENFAEFIKLLYKGEISSKIAKAVLKEMFNRGADPSHIIAQKGLSLISDEKTIEKAIKKIIKKNQKAVEDFQKGKAKALQFLIGQVMRETRGRAHPEITREVLTKILAQLK